MNTVTPTDCILFSTISTTMMTDRLQRFTENFCFEIRTRLHSDRQTERKFYRAYIISEKANSRRRELMWKTRTRTAVSSKPLSNWIQFSSMID